MFAHVSVARSDLPHLVWVRVGLYLGLLLHMTPALFFYQENYAANAWRLFAGNSYIFTFFPKLATWQFLILALLWLLFVVLGLLGLLPRLSASVVFLLTYVFHQANALALETLGLQVAYGLLLIFATSGAGSTKFAVNSCLRWTNQQRADNEQAASFAVAMFLLSSIFWAGVEKLYAGWLQANTLYYYLASPAGVYVHNWVLACAWLRAPQTALVLGGITICLELITPLLFWLPKLRTLMALLLILMFTGFVAVLQLPLLFPLVYLPYLGSAVLQRQRKF